MKSLIDTKDGYVVVDNELVPSRAGDVESKTVSEMKTGKEGPVADCFDDSPIGILLGMRLRVTGESQGENTKKVVESVPPIT